MGGRTLGWAGYLSSGRLLTRLGVFAPCERERTRGAVASALR